MKYYQKLLNTYPILNSLNADELAMIQKSAINQSVVKDEIVKGANDLCQFFPLLIDGELEVSKISVDGNQTFLFNLKAGQFCHQSYRCMIDNNSLSIEVKAKKDSELILLPSQLFYTLVHKNIIFYEGLYLDLLDKYERLINKQETIIHESIDERILKYLKKYKCKEIKITHQMLANELGTAREVISRHLKKLEHEGKVSLTRGKIIVYCDK